MSDSKQETSLTAIKKAFAEQFLDKHDDYHKFRGDHVAAHKALHQLPDAYVKQYYHEAMWYGQHSRLFGLHEVFATTINCHNCGSAIITGVRSQHMNPNCQGSHAFKQPYYFIKHNEPYCLHCNDLCGCPDTDAGTAASIDKLLQRACYMCEETLCALHSYATLKSKICIACQTAVKQLRAQQQVQAPPQYSANK